MLAQYPCHATLPCADLERAKQFYAEKLEMKPVMEHPGGAFYECADGTRFFIFPNGKGSTADNTALGFRVNNIEKEITDLRANGVVFEEYETPKTTNGVASWGPNTRTNRRGLKTPKEML
jgi:catechol 2,3-dioxygenase-like lactoylglutathione lyase family enzyme